VHPQNNNYKSELTRLKDAGVVGVKLHPCYQGFVIDDPEAFPMYEEIVRAGMICVFHAGFDPVDTTRSFSTPRACLKVHRIFPEMKMVLAHMGGAKEVEDAEKYLWGEDIYIDIAVMAGYAKDEEILRFLKKHRTDRILYGSDFPWHDAEELEFLDAMPMDGALKEKILGLNARALLDREQL
jgi:predicted TIM-barrel fold metal-dependent hydrolase